MFDVGLRLPPNVIAISVIATRAVAAALLAFTPAHTARAGDIGVDLEIVLAVDASGSVDATEYRLQLSGIAAAFRDVAIQQAIVSGPRRAIAVSMIVWADATTPKSTTAWHIIAGPDDAERFAKTVEQFPRSVRGATGIGSAIAHAMRMFERNGIAGTRQVVDVSGDGIETAVRHEGAILLPLAHAMARARKVTINGLAITADVPDLDRWYAENVIYGPGSFVMKASDFHDFARAIRAKLLREISPAVGLHAPSRPMLRRAALAKE